MPEILLKEFRSAVEDTFRRYLFTLNFLSDGEPQLREAFRNALRGRDVFSRDPLVSVIPAYKPGESVEHLISRSEVPLLHPKLSRLAAGGFDPQRPLYEHQVTSIKKACANKNIVVATGTGSGKTECFLLPLLDDALRNPGPGLRAIIVYPLNALANDQLDRLRRLLSGLPEITFGRYTGDTKWQRSDFTEEQQRTSPSNERLSRTEIRERPPHILLTNFAMLEYLLLRPKDNDIFKEQRLRFVVLDEAHTYSGAQGIDVSLLMRRLQQAFRPCRLQFILTSATMGSDTAGIANFARTLTGGPYEQENVIVGNPVRSFDQDLDAARSFALYQSSVSSDQGLKDWLDHLDDATELRSRLMGSCLSSRVNGQSETAGKLLASILKSNRELQRLHELASERPQTIQELSTRLWESDSPDACRVTEWMVALGSRAVDDPEVNAPLLPARYHFFLRSLRGASLCLSTSCASRASHAGTTWSNIILDDVTACPVCSASTAPLLTCSQCGTPYIRVNVSNGKWNAVQSGFEDSDTHLLFWAGDSEDEDDESEEEEGELTKSAELCVSCQAIEIGGQLGLVCCEKPERCLLKIVVTKRPNGLLSRCPVCAGRAQPFPSVLRDFNTGEDAATAVIAEAVIRRLPSETTLKAKPADGRRLLCFSDSRQRAAYFAPYLARTTAETQYMGPLLEATLAAASRAGGDGASFEEISEEFTKVVLRQKYVVVRDRLDNGEYASSIKRAGQLTSSDKRALGRECMVSLFDHFTASPRNRRNLPGLALAFLNFAWSDEEREQLPQNLQWLFRKGWHPGNAVLQWCLRIFAWRKALTLPATIQPELIGPKSQPSTFHNSKRGRVEGRQVHRWNPYKATLMRDQIVDRSPQAEVVAGFLGLDRKKDASAISDALDGIWSAFRDLEVIRPEYPSEFQIPYERLCAVAPKDFSVCSRCGLQTPFPVHERCVMPGCSGKLVVTNAETSGGKWLDHHLYTRFTSLAPLTIEVREHTAQLTSERGAQYQRDFNAGDVNVLSCSTTFEMGVDVGQLKAVFLRNVPPTSANYIQRAGRAGRRREGAAFAITFARSTPHDQTHFFNPIAIVHGDVPVPRIALANRKLTQRHVNSYLLGEYLRSGRLRITNDQISVGEFFLEPTPGQSAAMCFGSWLEGEQKRLLPVIRSIIDPRAELEPESALFQSRLEMEQALQVLLSALEGYDRQLRESHKELSQAQGQQRFAALRSIESAERLVEELKTKDRLIDFLASEPHWLPSYAFPQDVARLLVRQGNHSQQLRLERDLEYAIAEYAPGSEIIADGKLLVSGGIDLRNRELDVRAYRICSKCNRVERAGLVQDIPSQCPVCGTMPSGPRSRSFKYIVPRGFTTLIDDPVAEVTLFRLKPPSNSEVFLVEGAREQDFAPHAALPGVSLGHSAKGTLFRANSGPKGGHFIVCRFCGNAKRDSAGGKKNKDHRKPWGPKCSGGREVVDLVCEFETDTLQVRFDKVKPAPPAVSDRSFWFSLQNAFVTAATDVLNIPRRDLEGTYRSQGEGSSVGELVVYDRVPGGAGYVERIRQELPLILQKTWERVEHCPNPTCVKTGSCYACLKSFGNQFNWDVLRRDTVAEWLSDILRPVAKHPPEV